jgi:predicted nucleic-acid-binding protein
MTGLDTNILIRYLTQDDPAQFHAALRLLTKKSATYFVPDLVLVEVDWVLSGVYGWTRNKIAETFARLLTIHNLIFEDEGRIRGALKTVRLGADLSDALIAALSQERGCQQLATFDKGLLKHFPDLAVTPK